MRYLIALMLIGMASLGHALPIGNPADASLYRNGLFWGDCYDNCCDPCDPCFSWCDAWSIRIGFYGDYVFDRHMERKSGGMNDLDDFEIFTNAGFIALNICNRFDIFGTLGTTNLYLDANPQVFGVNSNEDRFNLWTETHFSWSVGGRLTVWSCDCFYFGIEGQYFYTKPDVKRITAADFFVYPDDNTNLKYTEWQVGVGASYFYQIACSGIAAIPYIGIKWSGSCADFGNAAIIPVGLPQQGTLFNLENKKFWGWGFGMTLLFCEAMSVTVEGRWADEKAVHVNGQFRF